MAIEQCTLGIATAVSDSVGMNKQAVDYNKGSHFPALRAADGCHACALESSRIRGSPPPPDRVLCKEDLNVYLNGDDGLESKSKRPACIDNKTEIRCVDARCPIITVSYQPPKTTLPIRSAS